jgi:hypothetical protein
MIAASSTVKVLVATKPVDFRKGADGLAALVRPLHDGAFECRFRVWMPHCIYCHEDRCIRSTQRA